MSRNALVVGINTYQYLPGLQAPAQDAEAIAQKLQTFGEFRIQRLPEVIQSGQPHVGKKTLVTLRDLETALISLFKPRGSNIPHTALFYFSGHGIQRDAGIHEGYLAVGDSQPEVGFYGLSLFWLRRLLQESPVRQRIVILDCCHSGEFLNFVEADPGARAGTDRLFMAASREFEAAYESLNSSYSVFTQALLEGLDPQNAEAGIVTSLSLTATVSQSLTRELQQPMFENSGSEIILTRRPHSQRPDSTPASSHSPEICPYRGLEFFDESHAAFFFGRQDVTEQLLEKLRTHSSATILGASGSGKTSVLRAGLLPALRQGQRIPGSDRWRIKLMTPLEHPLRSLASVFIDPELNDLDRAEQLQRAEQFLQSGSGGLSRLVRASLAADSSTTTGLQANSRPRMLLVIDQLEEVFTLCTSEEERQQFFDGLTQALQEADDCFSLVIGLRSDFFHKCLHYRKLSQLITQRMVMLKPLSYEQIKDTIVCPARKVGLVCEPNLIYTMLLDIIGAPGELALLQYTLLELWHQRQPNPSGGPSRLTLNAYTELGGVRGTLQKRATETFYSLTPEEQVVAKRVFLSLTQLGEGTEDTRRRVLKSELMTPALLDEVVTRTLEKLVAAKLIVTNRENLDSCPDDGGTLASSATPSVLPLTSPGQETIDVAHEALIRNWQLLREWLEENRDMLRRQRRIEQAAQEWDSAGQPLNGAYLLQELRLRDTEDFIRTYPQELSALAQQFVAVSQAEVRRRRRQAQQRRLILPSALMVTLAITLSQHRSVLETTAVKNHQLQLSTSREQAAIAQSILQDASSNATTALLISRLAAEQNGRTYEAQNSIRAALRDLRLQQQLRGHEGEVRQLVFSRDGRRMATAGTDGTIRLWTRQHHTLYATASQTAQHVLRWQQKSAVPSTITGLLFSPDGRRVMAIARGQVQVQVWDAISGAPLWQIRLPETARKMVISPDGRWLAVSGDRTLSIWDARTGQFQTNLLRPATLRTIQFSPDSQLLMAAGEDGAVQLWRVQGSPDASLELLPGLVLQHSTAVRHATFSPSGRWIGTATADGKTALWEVATGQLRQEFLPPLNSLESSTTGLVVGRLFASTQAANLQEVRFSPDESLLASVSQEQEVWLWNIRTFQLQTTIPAPSEGAISPDPTSTVVFSPGGQWLARLSPSQSIATLWNTRTGQPETVLGEGLPAATAVQFSPDGNQVATAGADGVVRLWTTETGGELLTITLSEAEVQWATFMPTTAPIPAAPELGQPVRSGAALDTTGSYATNLVTISGSGRLERWEIQSQAPEALALPSPSPIHVSNLDPQKLWDGLRSLIPQSRQERTIRVESGLSNTARQMNDRATWMQQAATLPASVGTTAGDRSLTAFALSADGQLVATAAHDQIEIRQLRAGQETQLLHRLQANQPGQAAGQLQDRTPTPIRHLVFSPDQQMLLGVGDDFNVRLWDVPSGQLRHLLQGHRAPIRRAEFSLNGQRIVTASLDKTVVIWDARSARPLLTLTHNERVSSASFSPDGKRVVTTTWDGTAHLFDATTGKLQLQFNGHQGSVLDAQFSPDGRSLVTASVDGTARLWDTTNGELQGELRPDSQYPILIRRAFFSPDGQYVATLTDTGKVYLWAATWETLLRIARDRSLRQLTPQECSRHLRLRATLCPQLDSGSPLVSDRR